MADDDDEWWWYDDDVMMLNLVAVPQPLIFPTQPWYPWVIFDVISNAEHKELAHKLMVQHVLLL
jgi:hypothetical protein